MDGIKDLEIHDGNAKKKGITSKYEFVLLELLGDSSNKNSYNLYNIAELSWY